MKKIRKKEKEKRKKEKERKMPISVSSKTFLGKIFLRGVVGGRWLKRVL